MDVSAYLVHAATRQMAESDAIEEQFAGVDTLIARVEEEAGCDCGADGQAGELTEQECREVDEALVRGEDRRGSRTSGPRRVSGRVPVYDSGMLIAPADRKAKAVALHKGLRTSPHRTLVLGSVLTQVWRADPALVHALAGASKECTVSQARSAELAIQEAKAGRPECLTCATGPDAADWRRIETVLGQAAMPAKKRSDAVDVWVARLLPGTARGVARISGTSLRARGIRRPLISATASTRSPCG